MRKTRGYLAGLGSEKLFTNRGVLPQVVFATFSLCTKIRVTPILSVRNTQPYTQQSGYFNGLYSYLSPVYTTLIMNVVKETN